MIYLQLNRSCLAPNTSSGHLDGAQCAVSTHCCYSACAACQEDSELDWTLDSSALHYVTAAPLTPLVLQGLGLGLKLGLAWLGLGWTGGCRTSMS